MRTNDSIIYFVFTSLEDGSMSIESVSMMPFMASKRDEKSGNGL